MTNVFAQELAVYIADQEHTWGGMDELILSRYISGTCSEEERRKVEEAAEKYPAVRECLDLVEGAI